MGNCAKQRVLIVESVIPATAGLLRENGYNVEIARDGADAFDRICASPPEVAVLDARGPRADGIEWCRLIKANPAVRDVKLVVLIPAGQWGRVFEAFAAGCDDYLVEPLDRTELGLKMKELLKFSHLRGRIEREAPGRRHWTPVL